MRKLGIALYPDKTELIEDQAYLKMVKDSAFQLSVQPFLGIEVFRAEISVDSVKVIDRMNKRYVADNYANLKGQTPIEFNFIICRHFSPTVCSFPDSRGSARSCTTALS